MMLRVIREFQKQGCLLSGYNTVNLVDLLTYLWSHVSFQSVMLFVSLSILNMDSNQEILL